MSNYPAVPLILDRKVIHAVNTIIGGGVSFHASFLQEMLGGPDVEVEELSKFGDIEAMERIALGHPVIVVVPNVAALSLADNTKRLIGIWSSEPIRKRTAAIRALSRRAMLMLGILEINEAQLDLIGDQVITQLGEEAPPQAMLWAATWMLTDPNEIVLSEKLWKHPWDSTWGWAPPGVSIITRLNTLYRDLGAWVFARDDNKKGAEMMGCGPSKFQYLKDVRMDPVKVDKALVALSTWNIRKDSGYSTALKIGAIFEG